MSSELWVSIACPLLGSGRAFRHRQTGAVAIVEHEPVEIGGAAVWHLSISCARRYPTWDEIKQARYGLLPDAITMAMLLPPSAQYVNVHPNCFHLWEVAG